jgi:hypothetical protein
MFDWPVKFTAREIVNDGGDMQGLIEMQKWVKLNQKCMRNHMVVALRPNNYRSTIDDD